MEFMKYIVIAGVWTLVLFYFTGCAQLLGVKSYKSGDTEIQFTSGFDVGFSANQIDTVDNRRGINQK